MSERVIMKVYKLMGYLMLAAGIASPLIAEEDASVKRVKEAIKQREDKQVEAWLQRAKQKMSDGEYESANFLLSKVLDTDEDNKQAKALKEINREYLKNKVRQNVKDQSYIPIKDRDLLKTIEKLEGQGRQHDAIRKLNETGKKTSELKQSAHMQSKEKDWAQPILDNLEQDYDFITKGSGKDIAKKMGSLLGVNVVVDASVRQLESFKETLEIEYKNMSGKNIAKNLSREWGVTWFLQDEALVISKTLPQQSTASSATPLASTNYAHSTYREMWGFPRVDFGDLGLKAAMAGPGLGEHNNPYVIAPGYQVVSRSGQVTGGYGGFGAVGTGHTRTIVTADGQILLLLPNGQIISSSGIGGNGFLK